MATGCEVILPCRDEGPALELLLPRVPPAYQVIVVDNGSSDNTAEVATRHGARVVRESTAGYGAAVQAGVEAATADFIAVMDGDDSMDPADLDRLLGAVRDGEIDLAVGRRRPVGRGAWPWHARVGNALVVAWLRRRLTMPIHDIAPMRVCRREALLALDVRDRRFGYPVELLRRAGEAGWRVKEFDISYRPRAAGTRSKVSGSVKGTLRTARDFAQVLR